MTELEREMLRANYEIYLQMGDTTIIQIWLNNLDAEAQDLVAEWVKAEVDTFVAVMQPALTALAQFASTLTEMYTSFLAPNITRLHEAFLEAGLITRVKTLPIREYPMADMRVRPAQYVPREPGGTND